MRQGQQSRRPKNHQRGGKSQSLLTRNFESNGPNMKIRGTAAHIAEKYTAHGRDISSSDGVAAENFFQHAEHYIRILTSARQAQENGADAEDIMGEEDFAPIDPGRKQGATNGNGAQQGRQARGGGGQSRKGGEKARASGRSGRGGGRAKNAGNRRRSSERGRNASSGNKSSSGALL